MKSFDFFLNVAALFIYGIITVVTCAAVWNAETKDVLDAVAWLMLIANAYVIYRGAKALAEKIKENGIK